MNHPFTKNMTISTLLDLYPGAESIMLENGLHCTSCHGSTVEPFDVGAASHGLSPETVDKIFNLIVEKYLKYQENIQKHGISITQGAKQEIQDILKEEDNPNLYLKIGTFKDEFGDTNYSLDFHEEKSKEDTEIVAENIHFIISPADLNEVKNIELDFLANEYEEGFKISKPKTLS